MSAKTIGELLLERGLVSREKLLAALQEQKVTRERIGKILVRNGFLRQDDLYKILREINPGALHDEAVFQSLVPAPVLLETKSMITAMVEGTIYLGTLSSPGLVQRKIAPYLGSFKLSFTAVNPVKLNDYLRQLHVSEHEEQLTWERIFHDAMRVRASDIHILPRHSSYAVMTRRNGVLQLAHEGTLEEYVALVSRVKDLAKMDMAERRRPQDGGFSMDYSGRVVSFRVVTVPTIEGERMVVRILDPDSVNLSLSSLGISRIDVWRQIVARPDGLCLICGPTGSGKTTTLASTVREMNFLERAIYSAEDPVEHRIPYAGQVNVNPLVNLDFAGAVRTSMRSDPDVILVGEIRDLETARNAIKAASTGHLVIATLHTGSILTSVGRLRDIGVESYELRHLLRGVMVQKLMRVYCADCHGRGCPACGGSGYGAREVVSVVAYFKDEAAVDSVLAGTVSWPTIMEDGRDKVAAGKTSEAEFARVFGMALEDAFV